jgi:two-component system sensor histidine kinase LytS
MFDLLSPMLERLGIIVTIALILTRLRFFRDMIYQERLDRGQEYTAALFFGFFGIIGTYTGVTLSTDTLEFNRWAIDLTTDEAIANSRVIGIVLAGLLGGYKVGIGAGLIAGIHRFTLGGFTGLACGLAAIAAGIISAAFHRKYKHPKLPTAFLIGALAETVQMLIILAVAKPFEQAFTLVEVIGFPMILANGLGSALFLLIVKNVVNEEEKAGALQAQKTLRIANQTLVYLRKGLDHQSAKEVCKILHNEVDASAVGLTNQTEILAHIGLGDDHHQAGVTIQTTATQEVITSGELLIVTDKIIHCSNKNCKLGAAIIAPLKQRGKTIGTLKFYFRSEKSITNVVIELISGLSELLSNQLEISEGEKAYQLAKEAEIKALQAQISPHFLFNTLNTIVSLIRIDPIKARKLLVSLSHFLRQNLSGTTATLTTLEQELNHVKAYLSIEETRFIDKLKVVYDIDENTLTTSLPPLTLQPIVENAIKHGIRNMDNHCLVKIHSRIRDTHTLVCVEDNGKGIEQDRMTLLGTEIMNSETGTGMGLYNVNKRLTMMFGKMSTLQIESEPNQGTKITFQIPNTEE